MRCRSTSGAGRHFDKVMPHRADDVHGGQHAEQIGDNL
jgi:hypothetical protein